MTKLEAIIRLAEIKGSLRGIHLLEVSEVRRDLSALIEDLLESVEADDLEKEECLHEWRFVQDASHPGGNTLFCKLCGERDE